MPICIDCGQEVAYLHKHHPAGEKEDPEWTVLICLNCHRAWHDNYIFFWEGADEFRQWVKEHEQRREYIPLTQYFARVREIRTHHVFPLMDWRFFDSWDEFRQTMIQCWNFDPGGYNDRIRAGI